MSNVTQAPAFVQKLGASLDTGFRAGADRIAETARATAPVLKIPSRYRVPGQLREAIGVERDTVANGQVRVSVGIDKAKAFYGLFQEVGFRAVGRGSSDGGGRFVPGLRFMQHAFDTHRAAIVADAVKRVQSEIDKVNA